MMLRGFDSYEITLGDEMRGERASMGKSLEDAEREMRLKSHIIEAIENCDLAAFPNKSVVAGYVRSYSRYLGLDADACYERFCSESGFQSPSALFGQQQKSADRGRDKPVCLNSGAGLALGQSRFAAPPVQSRFSARISLGALTSSMALVALICGLSYGGYALLKDIQRVGFEPLPAAPSVVADAPEIATPSIEIAQVERPPASVYDGGGPLAAMASPAMLLPIAGPERDGPISAINPDDAGIIAHAPARPRITSGAGDIHDLEAPQEPAGSMDQDVVATAPQITGVTLHATEDAWIRVNEASATVLFEGILVAGQRFDLPDRVDAPILKAGNAGGIYILVDGVVYGPVGERGAVARNVSLLAEDVRSLMPKAEDAVIETSVPDDVHRRAEAEVTR